MVATKHMLIVLIICALLIISGMETTEAAPFGCFSKKRGDSGIGPLLAAGIVVSLLQHHNI